MTRNQRGAMTITTQWQEMEWLTRLPGHSSPSTAGSVSIQVIRPSKPMVFDSAQVSRHHHQTMQLHPRVINSRSTGSQPPPATMYMQGHKINGSIQSRGYSPQSWNQLVALSQARRPTNSDSRINGGVMRSKINNCQ